jgi:L-lactate dehydrogenase (cytochrome)
MSWNYNHNYPGIDDLIKKAKSKVPLFAFEYLDGGCNEDVNLKRNVSELHEVQLEPRYLKEYSGSSLKTTLFGVEYDAPFGIAPVGLQGLMWPGAPEILAKAAHNHNFPFVLSTVSTASIETIGEITEGKAWYQLYHPAEEAMRDDILERCKNSGYDVLVLLCDVPSFGYRPRDIRNGLAMPPRMTLSNLVQIMTRPEWAIRTLLHGQPEFATMKKYMPKGLNMKELGKYMNKTFSGRLNEDRLKKIRDQWNGKIVLKGVSGVADAEMAIRLGLDGIIVSNHGGRQLDAGESSIHSLQKIVQQCKDRIVIMMDSGIRSGPDVARAMAAGAEFTFLGRTFMYGVAALGAQGGEHTAGILKTQLQQVMDQLCCESTEDFPSFLIK